MKRTIATTSTMAAALLLMISALVAAAPASATPARQKDCSSCHGSGYAATVTAGPSTATPAAGRTYSVSISISENPSGAYGTGFWIAASTSAGATGATTGVYQQSATGSQALTASMTAPSAPGTYYYKVFGEDGPASAIGRTGYAVYSVTVPGTPGPGTPGPVTPGPVLDQTAPTTSLAKKNQGWHNATTIVELKAADEGSGVASTEYSLDGGWSWNPGRRVTVVADPLTHLTDGSHLVSYRSIDRAGNVEQAKTFTIGIDTVRPRVSVCGESRVRPGAMASIRYRVEDVEPSGGTADVVLRIATLKGRAVKTIRLSDRRVNERQTVRFRCRLGAGTYRVSLSGKDAAGNAAGRQASGLLIVRH